MLARNWLDRMTALDPGARLGDAREALATHWNEGNRMLGDGLDASRALGENLVGGARRVAHSTREQIGGHPLETALIVGLASFAIGWIAARQLRRSQPRSAARKSSAARARPSGARTRSSRASAH